MVRIPLTEVPAGDLHVPRADFPLPHPHRRGTRIGARHDHRLTRARAAAGVPARLPGAEPADLRRRPARGGAVLLEGHLRGDRVAVANGEGGSTMTTAPVLRATDIVVQFGGLTAVDHISIDLHRKRITGLMGPNGAGKSTFF